MPPPPPPPSDNSGIFVVRLVIAFMCFVAAVALCRSCFKAYRNGQARAAANAVAAPRTPPEAPARNGELGGGGTNAAARLPAFKYSQSVMHNVTGGGEEAATCSVCLGAFQLGETVRLLPACLHLYHAECIDLWLICRSDTDPTMAVGQLQAV